jgi:hypothetical protein
MKNRFSSFRAKKPDVVRFIAKNAGASGTAVRGISQLRRAYGISG